MLDSNITDQFHQGYGFTNTSTTEQAYFTAPGDRHDQVDDLDTGFKHIITTSLFFVCGWFAVNRHTLFFTDGAGFIDRATQHIHYTAEGFDTHGNGNGRTSIGHWYSTFQTVG